MRKNCKYKDCSKNVRNKDVYCSSHERKVTIGRFLNNLYSAMKNRVTTGANTNRPDLYIGKPIMPKDIFLTWAKNHPDFLQMYKRWVMCEFDRKMTPTVNRINSQKGYTLDNVEWVTNSQNCGLSASVKAMKAKKEIYNLLGVNTDV